MKRKDKSAAPPRGTLAYSPEIATNWLPSDWFDDWTEIDPSTFKIYAGSPTSPASKAWIATITVNPAFDPKSRERIAWLMSCAPDLWQLLRKAAPRYLEDIEGITEFHDAMRLLWLAAGYNPFDFPSPNESEEDIRHRQNKASLEAIQHADSTSKVTKGKAAS